MSKLGLWDQSTGGYNTAFGNSVVGMAKLYFKLPNNLKITATLFKNKLTSLLGDKCYVCIYLLMNF